jgi:hypothetical protein
MFLFILYIFKFANYSVSMVITCSNATSDWFCAGGSQMYTYIPHATCLPHHPAERCTRYSIFLLVGSCQLILSVFLQLWSRGRCRCQAESPTWRVCSTRLRANSTELLWMCSRLSVCIQVEILPEMQPRLECYFFYLWRWQSKSYYKMSGC